MDANGIRLTPETRMRELVEQFPGAQRAHCRGYPIGGCSSCGFGPEETLAQVCARNGGLPVEEVMAFLSKAQEEDARMEVGPLEVKRLLEAGAARLVDVRTREEFDAVHIAGSVLFSEALMHELPSWDGTVVFVCHHGIRSLDAAAYFAGHGMTNVVSLKGGIDAWSCEVDPELPRYELA
jgi:rhodanese-related sulfurtransferase